MKALKTLALAAAACAFTAGSAQAAFHPTGTGLMNFINVGPTGQFEVGITPFFEAAAPYIASFNVQRSLGDADLLPGLETLLPGGPSGPWGNPYDIFCIDMINSITVAGDPYPSYFTNLGSDLASVGFSTRNHTQQEYKEAAYLASMWSGTAGHENVIQGAIWYVMNGAAHITAAWDADVSAYVDLATYTSGVFGLADINVNTWYGTGAGENWVVVTPTNAAGLFKGGAQEQLVHVNAVPEPATMVLLGTGLAIMLFGTGYIRRFTA